MSEFKKASAPMEMEKILQLAGAVFIVVALVGPLFLFLPFLLAHGLSLTAKMCGLAVYATTVAAIVLSWKYNHKLLPEIRNRLFRRAVGLGCYAGCLLWMRFGVFHFSPGGSNPTSFFLPLSVFGLEWAVMAMLGGVGHGLEKVASGHDQPAVS